MEEEKWKWIEGYEGLYQISSLGRVKSFYRGENVLSERLGASGYYHMELCKNGKCKIRGTHRLVAEAFIDNPLNYPQVNHIDEDPSNNKLENLEWVSRKQNMQHGTCIKRMKETKRKRQGHPIYIIDKDGSDYFFGSIAEACEEFGLDSGNVKLCLRGNRKRHHGYTFESCK